MVSTLPFDVLPELIIINIIKFGAFWIDTFPVKNGCSEVLSPREIVTKLKICYLKQCRVSFGTYCEVHDDPEITNNIKARTHEGISMGPTVNFQGYYKFFCLEHWKVITRIQFTKMAMPEIIIKRVNRWGKISKKYFLVAI